jgi:hypothetical protein
MRLAFAFVLALAACGGQKSSSGSSPAQPTVCAVGNRTDPATVKVEPCADGLSCCYPCGIDGCDSVCMDVSQTGECPMYP